MFLGEYEHTLDDKGRLAIPARFRPELGQGLVLTRGLDRCLFVWPLAEWRAVAEKLAHLSMMQADVRRLQRLLFAGAVDTQLDRLGRVLVPSFLREYAGLSGSAAVVGVLNRIEIWDKERYESDQAGASQSLDKLAQKLADKNIVQGLTL